MRQLVPTPETWRPPGGSQTRWLSAPCPAFASRWQAPSHGNPGEVLTLEMLATKGGLFRWPSASTQLLLRARDVSRVIGRAPPNCPLARLSCLTRGGFGPPFRTHIQTCPCLVVAQFGTGLSRGGCSKAGEWPCAVSMLHPGRRGSCARAQPHGFSRAQHELLPHVATEAHCADAHQRMPRSLHDPTTLKLIPHQRARAVLLLKTHPVG